MTLTRVCVVWWSTSAALNVRHVPNLILLTLNVLQTSQQMPSVQQNELWVNWIGLEKALSYSCKVPLLDNFSWRRGWQIFVKAQSPLVASRHDTTRHDTLSSPCILAQEKVVTCCVALVGQHGATRSSRRARHAWHVVTCRHVTCCELVTWRYKWNLGLTEQRSIVMNFNGPVHRLKLTIKSDELA